MWILLCANCFPYWRFVVFIPVNHTGDNMLGAVQVGYIDHEVVINPSRKDLQHSQLNLIVSAAEQKKVGEFASWVLTAICQFGFFGLFKNLFHALWVIFALSFILPWKVCSVFSLNALLASVSQCLIADKTLTIITLSSSSSSSSWREVISHSILPLRFAAKTICPQPAREHQSPIF